MKITFLFFLSICTLSSYAQQTSSSSNQKDFLMPMMMRGVGISFQKFDGLNSRIANRPEYKALRDYAGTLELGCIKAHNRFISGIDLVAGSSMSGDRDKKSSTIRYLGAGIDIGYDLVPNDRILLYPLVGIGGQGYMTRFYKDNSAVPFDVVLTTPDVQNSIRPVDFTNSFVTYRLGIGFAVKSPKNPSCTFGIQAGYCGSFKDKSWKSGDNQELAGAPEDGLSQFHASLIMTGMPGFMK